MGGSRQFAPQKRSFAEAFKTLAQIEATNGQPTVFKKPAEETLTLTLVYDADQRFDRHNNVIFVWAGKRADTGRGIALNKTLTPDPTRGNLATWRAFEAGQTIAVSCSTRRKGF